MGLNGERHIDDCLNISSVYILLSSHEILKNLLKTR